MELLFFSSLGGSGNTPPSGNSPGTWIKWKKETFLLKSSLTRGFANGPRWASWKEPWWSTDLTDLGRLRAFRNYWSDSNGHHALTHRRAKALHGHTWQSAISTRHDAVGLIVTGTKPADRQTDRQTEIPPPPPTHTHTRSLMLVGALLGPTGPRLGQWLFSSRCQL